MAAVQCFAVQRFEPAASCNVCINHQNGGKWDLSDFDCAIIVSTRSFWLEYFYTGNLLGFSLAKNKPLNKSKFSSVQKVQTRSFNIIAFVLI